MTQGFGYIHLPIGDLTLKAGTAVMILHQGEEDKADSQAINIYPSGRVVLPEGSDIDEQSKRFWEAVTKAIPVPTAWSKR